MADSPTLADVQAAAEAIAGRVHRTPVLTSATLAARCGAPVLAQGRALPAHRGVQAARGVQPRSGR